jgi:hypothetical protein
MLQESDDCLTGNINPFTQQVFFVISVRWNKNRDLNGENGRKGRQCEITAQAAAHKLSGPLIEGSPGKRVVLSGHFPIGYFWF